MLSPNVNMVACSFMHLLAVTGRKRKREHLGALCTLRVVNSFPPGLDKQLLKKLHFPAAFFGPFFQMAEAGISGLERSCRGGPGLLKPIILT